MWPYIIICPFPPPHSSGNAAAELGDIFIVFNENGILRKNASFESLILENITGLYIYTRHFRITINAVGKNL